uniref:Uncharacterized protein n=1 Tax=Oryza glumipatula TaxID=40148 RepID=A0A0E0ATC0_9ORYZ
MPPSQSHTPTLNEALPPQPSIFVAASASKDPGAWRRGTRATTTFFPSSASEDGRILVRMAATRRRVSPPQRPPTFFLYSAILVRSKLNYLMAIYLSVLHYIGCFDFISTRCRSFQTEKNKLLGSPYACVAVQMQPAMECHNELH